MKKKHSILSLEIIGLAFLTMFLIGSIIRLLIYILSGEQFRDLINEDNFFILSLVTLAITLITFALLINHFIARRIKEINKATLSIKEGNYDVKIQAKGSDEISALAENFNLMTGELKSNEYLNKEFIRNFSHEFKTPLSVIKGYAELINQVDTTEKEKEEYINIIISESERLSNLTNNMLQISMIDSKQIIKKDDEYNFAEQVRNIIQMTQLKWEEKNLSFNLKMEEVKINCNKELTYQIVLNLLSNAIKYSNKGSSINISLKQEGSLLAFAIENKGEDIPKEELDQVFNLFYTGSKNKRSDSTGVGLTLTKKIVDKLNGNISFTSKGGITSFKVILPN